MKNIVYNVTYNDYFPDNITFGNAHIFHLRKAIDKERFSITIGNGRKKDLISVRLKSVRVKEEPKMPLVKFHKKYR